MALKQRIDLLVLDKNPSAGLMGNFRYFLKSLVRNTFLFSRGPAAVSESLVTGLRQLNYSFKHNCVSEGESYESIGVLGDIGALRWAINAKRSGKVKRLVAGPNLCVLPTDFGGILMDDAIDKVIVPCQWVKDIYQQYGCEKFKSKIVIWPAGVNIPSEFVDHKTKKRALIYKKNVPEKILSTVKCGLEGRDWEYEIVQYGKFRQLEYWKKLEKAKVLIYLQESESQGLAIFEAWARNVPVFAWESGIYTAPDGKKACGKISVPYLSSMNGDSFSGENDFLFKFIEFEEKINSFKARDYVKDFTYQESARKYLEIL